MSTQSFQVRADTNAPADRSIFDLSAMGSETMVDTDLGLVPAKKLTTQHRLRTHGNGFATIEWVDRLGFSPQDLRKYRGLKPVLIPAGYFGPGLPRRSTVLSPRQMVWSKRPGGSHLAFGSARMLSPDPTHFQDQDISVSYVALACSRPVMFNAEGIFLSC